MSEKKPYQKKTKQKLNGPTVKPFTILSKPTVLSLLTFLLLSLLFTLLIYQRYELVKETKKKEAYEIVHRVKHKLQETLLYSLSATKTLTFFIDRNGQVNNFDSIAAQIFESGIDIDALQLVPGGVIKYIYPRKGNEKVIGYNVLQDPLRNKEARKAIEKKEMFFAGPFELKQGGIGVVGRLPVYRNNKFWGFSAVVIKMSTLYRAAGIDTSAKSRYHFQLSKINPDTKEEEFFLPPIKGLLHHQSVSIEVPDGEWKLSVTTPDANRGFQDILILILLCSLLSVLGAALVYRFAKQPQKLNELVINRTLELKASENNYRSLIERVSDAFVAINKDWEFTYVNERAGEIFAKDPQSLIGKNIWKEFPEGINQPFYHAYYRAMRMQEYQYVEEYYSSFGKWLENHIYPSTEGLTIFFNDVTDMKRITQALKENEEKYRSLIEQASDGIVITDLDGIILEVNNSMKHMIGIDDEELTGNHITDYIPEEDRELLPFRIHELLQGKSLLYERRLLKKDGTFLDVEVNSKMASSHTLIGFTRDITERKKYENKLMHQARVLESVSDAVTSLDNNRCIVSWNKACEELYGFTTSEAIGKRIPQLLTFEFPSTNTEEVFKLVFNIGQWKGEFNFIHPKTNAKVHLLSSINSLKNQDGQISGFIITSKDITERKNTEAEIKRSNRRFELIAQATNDAVWDHDLLLNETWGNNELYKLYGIKPGTQKINLEMYMERIHPEERISVEARMKQALDNGVNSITEEFRFRTANGDYKTFYDRAYIKYDTEGRALSISGAMQDITERKKAEADLFEKEKKLEQVLSSTIDNFYVVDAGYVVVLINKVAEKNLEIAWGKPVKAGTNLLDVIPEYGDEPIKENFRRSLAGERIEYELYNSHPNLPAWVLIRFTPVINELGTIIAVSVMAKDITERKKAEVLMRESEERYKSLVENAPEALVVFDVAKQKFVGVSKSATRLFEMTEEEFLQSGPVILSPKHQPDGRLSADVAGQYIQKAVDGKNPSFEWTYCNKSGNPIPCEVWLVRLPSENEVLIRGTIIDITVRKKAEEALLQSEQKYRLLFYNNPLPMWMTTIPGLDIIDVNESAIKQYGYSKQEFLKLNARDMRPPEDVEHFINQVNKMKPGITNTRAWRHKKKDGTIIHVEIFSNEIFYEGRRVWLGLSHDVTEKYESKELLQKSYEDIRQLVSSLQSIREDERTNIAREIHDELGQQLTGLKMDLHWLGRKINSTDTEITGKLKESMELINATISSVRKISTDLRPSILDDLGLLPALEWQGQEFEKRSGTKVIFINKVGDFAVQPQVATGIFRIYQELLTNIARHANAGRVRAVLHKDDSSLYFSINDNGVGFDLDTIKNKKTLGLLGIKERTLLLGGTYEFKSRPGQGSVTTISIPLSLLKNPP